MNSFETDYQKLNAEQKQAVDTIDGPLLVIAGPGTGKTQLLSARVARILKQTDTLPQNILCLTFTDAAALNMRERLSSMINEPAYDVQINTYHSFASDIIRSYPEYFESVDLETGEDTRLERPIDEIRQLEIMTGIIRRLPYDDPLYNAKHYVPSVISVISDMKQANLTPADVVAIASANKVACEELSPAINEAMAAIARMPRKVEQALPSFTAVHDILTRHDSELATQAAGDLAQALDEATTENSTKPLTAWKNAWLAKDDEDQWTFTKSEQADKLLSLARLYSSYQALLDKSGEYDFNDMILKTINALQTKPELRFTLQEKYQYILLDEFQDTNQAQFDLVHLLADHPVHEGRPNIMAVGDDDQGIFAFQGANIGNMTSFLQSFRDVAIVNLTQNYRSHADILHAAHAVAGQIESRLHHALEGVTKTIEAASTALPKSATIERHEFAAQANEYGWIADRIASLVKNGVPADEIAVIAPKHALLVELIPFLNERGIPVTYEKRENIFETPIISGLLLFCQVLQAGAAKDMAQLDMLLPRLLSLDYWGLDVSTLWQLNWRYGAQRYESEGKSWTELALADPALHELVQFVLKLADKYTDTSLEEMLDYMTGALPLAVSEHHTYTSPLKNYYFSDEARDENTLAFYEALSHLSVIRTSLRNQQAQTDQQLKLESLITLYETYQEADKPLINTHPIAQAASAVQLQTVYKSKGLEYEYVFLPAMHDDVWGSKAGGSMSKISLPPNLQHIKHDASDEDTRRRLLFVAITRAKHGLFVTSHASTDTSRKNLPAKYMLESEQDGVKTSAILPAHASTVLQTVRDGDQSRQDVSTFWYSRHELITPDLRTLLGERLAHYTMSPTHLNTFTNLEYAGPHTFLLGALLRFPSAPTPDSIYGDALHHTLEWWQNQGVAGQWPTTDQAVQWFKVRLSKSFLADETKQQLITRGTQALRCYLAANAERLKTTSAKSEVDFRKEGAVLDNARLTGKIDRLEIDEANKTVRIIDFKSGAASDKWGSSTKYNNYKQQLYFYHLLVERSHSFAGYTVTSAALEFLEPINGKAAAPLELKFDEAEYNAFKQLVKAVWRHIQTLDLPDVSSYPATLKGIKDFEAALIEDK